MNTKIVLVFLISLISLGVLGDKYILERLPMQDDNPVNPPPVTESTTTAKTTVSTTTSPETTTTAKPTTTSTTTTTTAKPTTTSTTTTTTAPPPITTSSTTTTTPPPTTSTEKPTTSTPTPSTTPSPVTTPAPPTPPTPPGKWFVGDVNNTCIVAQMGLSLNISYLDLANKTNYAIVNITGNPNGTNSTGTCGKQVQTLLINFQNANLTITFNKTTQTDYVVQKIELLVDASAWLNSTGAVLTYTSNSSLFDTPLAMSYKCAKNQTVTLTSSANRNVTAALTVHDTQLQAFRNSNTQVFGSAADCDNSVPDIVPIAVGCSLAALVVVVLVAYLIGRRRARGNGYVSM